MPKSPTVLGSIPASFDTVESEGRQIKKSKISSLFETKDCLCSFFAMSPVYRIMRFLVLSGFKKPRELHTKKEIGFSGTGHEQWTPLALHPRKLLCSSLPMYNHAFKGSLTREFRLQVFFISQWPPGLCSEYPIGIVSNLSPVSTTPAITENPWQGLIAGVIDTGDKHSFENIFANFRKNSKRPQGSTHGSRGHWFMKKTWSRKSRVRLPLKPSVCGKAGEYTHTESLVFLFYINFVVAGMRKEAQRDSQRLFYLIITATEERVFYTGIL
jgi:hypothetical protein